MQNVLISSTIKLIIGALFYREPKQWLLTLAGLFVFCGLTSTKIITTFPSCNHCSFRLSQDRFFFVLLVIYNLMAVITVKIIIIGINIQEIMYMWLKVQ